jgi:hypothetical protein
LSKPRPPFTWASDDQPDKWASDDHAADHLDTCKASILRFPDKPPAIRIGRLVRRSCHAWNAVIRRRLEAAMATEAAVPPPVEPKPAKRRGRPRRSKSVATTPTAAE